MSALTDIIPEVEVVVIDEPLASEPCTRPVNADRSHPCSAEIHPADWAIVVSCGHIYGVCQAAHEMLQPDYHRLGCTRCKPWQVVHAISITPIR